MKPALVLPLALSLLVAGCSSTPFFLTSELTPALTAANLEPPLAHFSARANKGFLELDARAERSESDFRRDFDLELGIAAQVLAALGESEAVWTYDWHEIRLTLWIQYGSGLRWEPTGGYVVVYLPRETLRLLREQDIPVSGYPGHWRFRAGCKMRPGSEPLECLPQESEPGQDCRIEPGDDS